MVIVVGFFLSAIVCTLSRFGGAWLCEFIYARRTEYDILMAGAAQALVLVVLATLSNQLPKRMAARIPDWIGFTCVILMGVFTSDVAFSTWKIYREIGGVSILMGMMAAPLIWLSEGLIGLFHAGAIVFAIKKVEAARLRAVSDVGMSKSKR